MEARAPPHLSARRGADLCPSLGLSVFVGAEVRAGTGWDEWREKTREHCAPASGRGSAPLPGSTCPSHAPSPAASFPSPRPAALRFFPDVRGGRGRAGTSLRPERRTGPARPDRGGVAPRGRAARPPRPPCSAPRGERRRPHPGGPRQAGSPRQLPGLGPDTSPRAPHPAPCAPCAPYLPRPRATPRPTGQTRSPDSPPRSAGAGSFHSSPAVRSATRVLLWVFSSPPLPRSPPRPACICWTPAFSGHGRGVPIGARRGGLPLPHIGLDRAPLPGEAEPPGRPLSPPRPWRDRRTTPLRPLPPPPRRLERRGVQPALLSSSHPSAVELDPV